MKSKHCEIMKELRKENNLSQEELAKQLNLTQRTYSNYENGKRQPDINTLIEIAEYFHITLDTLTGTETKRLELLTETERKILNKYRTLNTVHKNKIEERIDTFIENQ